METNFYKIVSSETGLRTYVRITPLNYERYILYMTSQYCNLIFIESNFQNYIKLSTINNSLNFSLINVHFMIQRNIEKMLNIFIKVYVYV